MRAIRFFTGSKKSDKKSKSKSKSNEVGLLANDALAARTEMAEMLLPYSASSDSEKKAAMDKAGAEDPLTDTCHYTRLG
ncbi:MAG: hypothetical protein P1U40_03725 [Coxiellaceae bacterium]|nr:hypothetical protein [Coxiellaceae bacterium]